MNREVLECASPLCTLHASLPIEAVVTDRYPLSVRAACSPSPRPSPLGPLGRGRLLVRSFGHSKRSGNVRDGLRFSLSLRERAGVRGKKRSQGHAPTPSRDACKVQSPPPLSAFGGRTDIVSGPGAPVARRPAKPAQASRALFRVFKPLDCIAGPRRRRKNSPRCGRQAGLGNDLARDAQPKH
jgi:hypothetical protein